MLRYLQANVWKRMTWCENGMVRNPSVAGGRTRIARTS